MRSGIANGAFKRRGEKFVVVVEANPVLASCLADCHELFDRFALGFCLVHFLLQGGVVVCYDHLDFGGVESVFQILGGEHVRCRDGDCANAVQSEQEKPEFVATAQDEHHAVALLDTLFYKEIRRALGGKRQVLERVNVAFIVIVTPHEGFTLRLRLGIFVNNVISEVKIVRNRYLEIFIQVFIRLVINFR